MGEIKDIIELVKELESRAKDRKDIETLSKIFSEIREVQGQMFEIRERNFDLKQENADLKQKLEAKEEEEIRIYEAVEFRRGKRTGSKWMAFCPVCHMPAKEAPRGGTIFCTNTCDWTVDTYKSMPQLIKEL
jgi:regulator of replication initiation timing